jgi:hypothetical protein
VFEIHGTLITTRDSSGEVMRARGGMLGTGGTDEGDDVAELLKATWRETRRSVLHRGGMAEFHFRQYLFACQARVLLKLGCAAEVRGSNLGKYIGLVITFFGALWYSQTTWQSHCCRFLYPLGFRNEFQGPNAQARSAEKPDSNVQTYESKAPKACAAWSKSSSQKVKKARFKCPTVSVKSSKNSSKVPQKLQPEWRDILI